MHMKNGCPWYRNTCAYAARNGHMDCLRYAHEKMAVLGINRSRVVMQLEMDIWIVYVTHMKMTVLGMNRRVVMRPKMAI